MSRQVTYQGSSFSARRLFNRKLIFCVFRSLIKPEKYSGNRRGAYASEISTIGSENQVKTYMDSSNGVRNASSNAYNKVRASAVSLALRVRNDFKLSSIAWL